MTVGERGKKEGRLGIVEQESGLDTDQPHVPLSIQVGRILPDLTIGADVTSATPLKSMVGLSSNGVLIAGQGFVLRDASELARFERLQAKQTRPFLKRFIGGRDLNGVARNLKIIDLHGWSEQEVRVILPAVWQHLANTVKIQREAQVETTNTADARDYAARWPHFAKPRTKLRDAIAGLERMIVTVETSQHRMFQFVDAEVVPDHMAVVIASADAFHLGVLSSQPHVVWTLASGGTLEDRPRYTKSRCFDPFPFPPATPAQQAAVRALAEELDALRKRVVAEHGFLTMTKLYNVRERLRAIEAGREAGPLTEGERAIHDAGCVGVIGELHKRIDAAVADAYGWPADLSDDDVLGRLVALNRERAAEERAGHVRWLRPDYQVPRFGAGTRQAEQVEAELVRPAEPVPVLPKENAALRADLRRTLRAIGRPAQPGEIASRFQDGARGTRRVERALEALAATGLARRTANGWFVADRA